MAGAVDADGYQRAAALFGEVITTLTDEEWELTTHPDDWTAITTTAWVVVGDAQLRGAAEGEALGTVGEFDAAILGSNPVAAWRGTAVAAISALRSVDPAAVIVPHPDGHVLLADLLAQRVSENLVRAWDIGRAVGRPVDLPGDLADACLDFWADHADAVLAGGVLPDTPVEPSADASTVERFLALMGRTA
ncbi:MAG: hypothetical protein AAGC53_00975 [Actinomycetota bacterium]